MAIECLPNGIIEKFSDEKEVKEAFVNKFGVLRVIYSQDKSYVVFAYDRASGVEREDLYVYKHKDDVWVLMGTVNNSSRICAKIEIEGNVVKVLDFKGKLIVQFERNNDLAVPEEG